MKPEEALAAALKTALAPTGAEVAKMGVLEQTPEREAAARLAGTHDPSTVTVEVTLQLAKPVEFLTVSFTVPGEKP